MPCLEGTPTFRGGLGTTAKEAEHLAAKMALDAFADDIAALPPSASQLKRSERHHADESSEPASKRRCVGEPVNNDAKASLCKFLEAFLERPIEENDDLMFTTLNESDGADFQSTLYLVCLDGAPEFLGDVCPDEKQAERAACSAALEAYAEEIESLGLNEPREPKTSTHSQSSRAANAEGAAPVSPGVLTSTKPRVWF